MKRTYLRREMWHLGGRKNEIGDFYLFLAHLPDPCRYLQPVQLVGKFQKGWGKNWGGNHTEEDNEKGFNMSRNNILLRRLPNPKRVQLSSGGVFFAKYERVNRHELAPIHIRINRTYSRKIVPEVREEYWS